jgi:hypothetical protein
MSTDEPGVAEYSLRCGCGFTASGPDDEALYDMLVDHPCPNRDPTSWHESLFSAYGLAIALAFAVALMMVFMPS